MKILIDTNVLIWWLRSDQQLKAEAIKLLENNPVYVSIVSCWEIFIKMQTKKLRMPVNLDEGLEDSDFGLIPLKLDHLNTLEKLDMYHKDPFDRVIIAQAIHENLTIMTSDKIFKKYPVSFLKA